MVVQINLYDGLYKRSSMYMLAAEYLDKGSPVMQESWATLGAQVRLLFSV